MIIKKDTDCKEQMELIQGGEHHLTHPWIGTGRTTVAFGKPTPCREILTGGMGKGGMGKPFLERLPEMIEMKRLKSSHERLRLRVYP